MILFHSYFHFPFRSDGSDYMFNYLHLAVWNQYDDAIFSEPGVLRSLWNRMPFVKDMDPAEGRKIATWAMLPRWEGFVVDGGNKSMSAWEAIGIIKDLAYCMTQTSVEENGRLTENVPSLYNFKRVRYP